MLIRTRDLVVSILPLLSPLLPTADAGLAIQHGHEQLHLRSSRFRLQPRKVEAESVKTTVIARSPAPSIAYPSRATKGSTIIAPAIRSNDSQQQRSSYSPEMKYLPNTQSATNTWLPESMQSLTTAVDALSMAYPMDPSTGSLLVCTTS